jgi:hypothetical protein
LRTRNNNDAGRTDRHRFDRNVYRHRGNRHFGGDSAATHSQRPSFASRTTLETCLRSKSIARSTRNWWPPIGASRPARMPNSTSSRRSSSSIWREAISRVCGLRSRESSPFAGSQATPRCTRISNTWRLCSSYGTAGTLAVTSRETCRACSAKTRAKHWPATLRQPHLPDRAN